MSDLFLPELEELLKDYDILRCLTPSGAVWGDIPWYMLTDKDKQEIIDYYKAHPDIENPYYNETGVGKAPLYTGTGTGKTYIGGTAVSNPTPEPTYTTNIGGPMIGTPTSNAIYKAKQTAKQYWWAILIIVAVIVYFVFFRKKRRRR